MSVVIAEIAGYMVDRDAESEFTKKARRRASILGRCVRYFAKLNEDERYWR